ncbi:MAG TPA: two pore domain potassium channel family protein [Burkholderiaceae bacterium]|nr:two pore domain potassium channel family protein [Burkholderiaceae bacterium]
MYESKSDAVLPTRDFLLRMARHLGIALAIVLVAILVGMAGHAAFEPVNWHDAVLNVSLMLAGIGPAILPQTIAGKVFFAFYNILVSLVFVALIGVVMAPVVHRVIHKFHLDEDDI